MDQNCLCIMHKIEVLMSIWNKNMFFFFFAIYCKANKKKTWLKQDAKNLAITSCSMFYFKQHYSLTMCVTINYICLGISVFFESTGCWTKEKIPIRKGNSFQYKKS